MNGRFSVVGRRRGHSAVTNFSLVDIDAFLQRRGILLRHCQLILKGALLLGGVSQFLFESCDLLLQLLAFVLGVVLGSLEGGAGGFSLTHSIRIQKFHVAHLTGERLLVF